MERMTRKRLKRLLMSCGYQRNEAEAICWMANSEGMPYKEYWAKNLYRYQFRKAAHVISTKIKKAIELIQIGTVETAKAFMAFAEGVRNIMETGGKHE